MLEWVFCSVAAGGCPACTKFICRFEILSNALKTIVEFSVKNCHDLVTNEVIKFWHNKTMYKRERIENKLRHMALVLCAYKAL